MPLTFEELPTLIFWLLVLGVSGYVTVWSANKVRGQIEAVLR